MTRFASVLACAIGALFVPISSQASMVPPAKSSVEAASTGVELVRRGGGGGMRRGGMRGGGMERRAGSFDRGGARAGNRSAVRNRDVTRNRDVSRNRDVNRNVNVDRNRDVRRTATVRRTGNWSRPGNYWWRPGGAIAAGAAIGFVTAATAVAWAGAPPAAGMCWYYTDASRTNGFWDTCPR